MSSIITVTWSTGSTLLRIYIGLTELTLKIWYILVELLYFTVVAGATIGRSPEEELGGGNVDQQRQTHHQVVAARRPETAMYYQRPQVGHTCSSRGTTTIIIDMRIYLCPAACTYCHVAVMVYYLSWHRGLRTRCFTSGLMRPSAMCR